MASGARMSLYIIVFTANTALMLALTYVLSVFQPVFNTMLTAFGSQRGPLKYSDVGSFIPWLYFLMLVLEVALIYKIVQSWADKNQYEGEF